MRSFGGVVGAVLMVAVSAAQSTDLQGAIRDCARLRNHSERLLCYDQIAAQLPAGAEPPAETGAAPQSLFGASDQAGARQQAQREAREELRSITAHVKALRQSGGRLQIELDNGQVWQQQDTRNLALKPGDRVTLSRAAFGSFRIATPGNRHGRVTRVQ